MSSGGQLHDVNTYTDSLLAVTDDIIDRFIGFLNDYTTDRRGDVGSLIRLEAIQATKTILQEKSGPGVRPDRTKEVIRCLCRLAAEKLDKVRVQAWLSLQDIWESEDRFPSLKR